MKLKVYKSHLTVTSSDDSKEGKKSKMNLINVEKYIKNMILISIRAKKFFEKNDYFYEEEKRRKFDLKNIKIKLTPFQKYQKLKTKKFLTTEKQINNTQRVMTSYPIYIRDRLNKNNQNLITINNLNFKNMRKNKTDNNNQFYLTHMNFFRPQKCLLSPLNENTESNDNDTITSRMNHKRFRSKSNYHTISAKKTNKKIQTTETKNIFRKKLNYKLDKFPILDIFNYKNNLLAKNLDYKSRNDLKERKRNLPFVNNDERKINVYYLNK
jgi:hypothetical protein